MGRKLQTVIAGRNPGPLYPESEDSEFEVKASRAKPQETP